MSFRWDIFPIFSPKLWTNVQRTTTTKALPAPSLPSMQVSPDDASSGLTCIDGREGAGSAFVVVVRCTFVHNFGEKIGKMSHLKLT